MMRIITGRARGTRLFTLEGEATRPTSERAKEALFSSLGDTVQGSRVLDLFSGSGQLGLEALSRGAVSAVLCESSKEAYTIIKKNVEKTRLTEAEPVLSDAVQYLRRIAGKRRFDLVFLDPPYASGLLPRVLDLLWEGDLLSPGATVICESSEEGAVFGEDASLAERYRGLRSARYGAAVLTYLTLTTTAEGGERI